ncbi:NAD-dependent protein deacylase sirtuin-5 [subsurface metagenome]
MNSIGVDIVEIDRIELAIERWGKRFLNRIYTEAELKICESRVSSLAGRFAGKEAVMKVLGTGAKGVNWREIEILADARGRALKYDVVHFKEPIPQDVSARSEEEALNCDLMLICGTSAVVYPFASLPRIAKRHSGGLPSRLYVSERESQTKIIEVNAEPTPLTHEGVSDYLIQGKTGEILPQIARSVKAKIGGKPGPQG